MCRGCRRRSGCSTAWPRTRCGSRRSSDGCCWSPRGPSALLSSGPSCRASRPWSSRRSRSGPSTCGCSSGTGSPAACVHSRPTSRTRSRSSRSWTRSHSSPCPACGWASYSPSPASRPRSGCAAVENRSSKEMPMLKTLIRWFHVALACGLLAAGPAAAALDDNLVDGAWLKENLESPEVLVLDTSPRPMHARAHIPGAVPVDVMMFMLASFSGRDVSAQEMERMYQAVGIDPAKKRIVIYDQGGSWFAPRLFFQLAYHGFPVEKLAILDGGLAKWQADGHPVSKDATPAPKSGSFKVTRVNEQERTRPAELVAASGDRKANVLVDAMGTDNHYGSGTFGMGGHIPHAVSMPAEDFYNADKTFKSPEEIRRMAALLGIQPDQEVHAHCGGGGAAAVPYFALKHLAGHSKVRLSVESQMGWLQDDRELPYWTYGAPAMMRDAEWLPAWGGRMLRMYGVSKVSVVDVRAPAAYAQGHVPFAVSMP